MRLYRLFILDLDDKIEEERPFQASSEASAIKFGDAMRAGGAGELWSTHHRIARLK